MKVRLVVLLAIACLLVPAASASASSGSTVLHFAVTYPGGIATCSGNRIQHTTGGKTFIKDVETCITVAAFIPVGHWDVNSPQVGGWCSDVDGAIFNLATCNPAISGHVDVSPNGDGTFTFDIVAYYAQP